MPNQTVPTTQDTKVALNPGKLFGSVLESLVKDGHGANGEKRFVFPDGIQLIKWTLSFSGVTASGETGDITVSGAKETSMSITTLSPNTTFQLNPSGHTGKVSVTTKTINFTLPYPHNFTSGLTFVDSTGTPLNPQPSEFSNQKPPTVASSTTSPSTIQIDYDGTNLPSQGYMIAYSTDATNDDPKGQRITNVGDGTIRNQ